MSSTFIEKLCQENYEPHESLSEFHIGFNRIEYITYLFPSLALTLNLISIINFIRERKKPKLSIEKMMFYLTVLEILISIYWLTNSILFQKISKLGDDINKCNKCLISSIFSVFFQNLDWMVFICTLYNLLKFFEDPAHEKSGYAYKSFWYFVVSIGVALMYSYFIYIADLYGLSPMLTCYINNFSTTAKRRENHDSVKVFSILILPLFYIISTIYLFIKLYKSRAAIKINESKKEIYKFLAYAFIYALFYFPTILLYIITINEEITASSFYSWFGYYCFIFNISLNLVLSIIRIFQGHVKINIISNSEEESGIDFFNDSMSVSESQRSFSINYKPGKALLTDENQDVVVEVTNKIIHKSDFVVENPFTLGKNINEGSGYDIKESLLGRKTSKTASDAIGAALRKTKSFKHRGSLHNINSENSTVLTNNIFIGLAYSLINSNSIFTRDFLSPKNFTDERTYKINQQNFHIENFKNVPKEYIDEHMNIEVIEYAPEVFNKLRNLDGIDNLEIVKSINVKHKAKITDSQGYSQAIFISTQDHKYVLKTLKEQEFKNVFDKFLVFYVNYLEKNPDSLLCRIYGIYRIKPSDSSDYLLFILLRNAKGPFNKYTDKTYDLKGSTKGRRVNIPDDPVQQKKITRKDLNFLEDEKNSKIENVEKFLSVCNKDAKFLEDFYFMDYSLFVVKLSFDPKSIAWLDSFRDSPDYSKYSRYIYKSTESDYSFYIFCIIDYFQIYDSMKQFETKYKLIGNNYSDIPEISCVPPEMYSFRFIRFLSNNFK